MKVNRWLFCGLCVLWLAHMSFINAQSSTFSDPDFFETLITDQLRQPTSMAFAPDGRLFVTQQDGTVQVIEDDRLLSDPFMSKPVVNSGERGLLGIAFDPQFDTNQYVYFYYTSLEEPQRNVISRFTASGNTVISNSETIIFEFDPIGGASIHNGGALAFGPDGMLYAGTGDGGNDSMNAQNRDNLFGSVVRLRPNGSIPTDNPFYDELIGKNRAIWAYGLRNPFVIEFQPETERMHIHDVGGGAAEEINLGQAGANYGWPFFEGNLEYGTPPADYVPPMYSYSIKDNTACAITGGAFYDASVDGFPETYAGDYFFADFCAESIWIYDSATEAVEAFASDTAIGIVDVEVGPDGALYYLVYNTTSLMRVDYMPD